MIYRYNTINGQNNKKFKNYPKYINEEMKIKIFTLSKNVANSCPAVGFPVASRLLLSTKLVSCSNDFIYCRS